MKTATPVSLETDITTFPSLESAVDYYYDYYLEHGYPNYDIKDYDPEKELERLKQVQPESIIVDGVARQSMLGCGFLWCFFPHWIEVETASGTSLAENWKDKEKLRKLIEKNVAYCVKHERSRWSRNRIRQNAKVYLSKQSPSNFRPTVAKALYDIYGKSGAVYDPCGGWGGRMFGFLASTCREYVCCDPSQKTYIGLAALRDTYRSEQKSVSVVHGCQEDYTPAPGHFDLVFTSPPYFDNERYSTEETQSYIRWKTLPEWCNGFLRPLIQNAYTGLKPDGTFILNIANTKNAENLEHMSVELACETGFVMVDEIKLALSSISGKGTKYEPMFVFKKGYKE